MLHRWRRKKKTAKNVSEHMLWLFWYLNVILEHLLIHSVSFFLLVFCFFMPILSGDLFWRFLEIIFARMPFEFSYFCWSFLGGLGSFVSNVPNISNNFAIWLHEYWKPSENQNKKLNSKSAQDLKFIQVLRNSSNMGFKLWSNWVYKFSINSSEPTSTSFIGNLWRSMGFPVLCSLIDLNFTALLNIFCIL